MTASKRILIIAGPNGAGKTTFATEFLPHEANCPRFVNADLIAAGVNPFEPSQAALRAGRVMWSMMRTYVQNGDSFAFETTLSGRRYACHIPDWQAQGYKVKLIFLKLPAVEVAICRVAQRVTQADTMCPRT